MFFIKVPSLNPNLPADLIADKAWSVASTSTNFHELAALSDISLYFLLSLIQYVPVSVLTAIPDFGYWMRGLRWMLSAQAKLIVFEDGSFP